MERVIKTIWKAAEPAKELIESALDLMVGSQAILWCAYLVHESDGGWRVVAGNGVGAPAIGEIWPSELLQRTHAVGTTGGGGGLFYKPIRLPGKEPHHSGMSALVLAQTAPEHAQRATIHTTLHRLFDRLHDLLSHLPLVHHDP
ncbi:MAG TPA: hypothetical protein VGW38_22010, partial [Chloroflexota bacterium]|nr:hypothetical protein [Chloroflexota bacterium]